MSAAGEAERRGRRPPAARRVEDLGRRQRRCGLGGVPTDHQHPPVGHGRGGVPVAGLGQRRRRSYAQPRVSRKVEAVARPQPSMSQPPATRTDPSLSGVAVCTARSAKDREGSPGRVHRWRGRWRRRRRTPDERRATTPVRPVADAADPAAHTGQTPPAAPAFRTRPKDRRSGHDVRRRARQRPPTGIPVTVSRGSSSVEPSPEQQDQRVGRAGHRGVRGARPDRRCRRRAAPRPGRRRPPRPATRVSGGIRRSRTCRGKNMVTTSSTPSTASSAG